jgi:signal transduction histidine kinase
MIHRSRVRILPLIAVTGAALALASCATSFAACPWTLRFAITLFTILAATAPAYWLGPRAEADLARRLASCVYRALRDHEHGTLVGHEMKTPLTGIKAYLELLADGDADDDDTRAEFLAGIASQVERLERTIDELLAPSVNRAAVSGAAVNGATVNQAIANRATPNCPISPPDAPDSVVEPS